MSEGAGKYYVHFDLFGLCWNWHIFPEKKYQLWDITKAGTTDPFMILDWDRCSLSA